ncbi:BspA family leucine-rich repeat surface protein [Mycoplasma yeatsii]|uniref:Myosin heavy subunit n=1 Tax=Mycoplasma yeatsii TaxID=51365 RepID=A0ABU0NDC8_9MOLU|nr:BspA family leucine-rich repeat surface protein [Mycoplasma yeatsii]MDQ0567442.1 myosin heavy subunit [Mycoplasma yeatsii]
MKKNNNNFIDNQNDQRAVDIMSSLYDNIRSLRENISKINEKINKLIKEKKDIEDQLSNIKEKIQQTKNKIETDKTKDELQKKLDELKDELKKLNDNRPDEIKNLELEKARLEKEMAINQAKLDNFKISEETFTKMILDAWKDKIEPTIWEAETCLSLLQRFEKETGIGLDLEEEERKDELIKDNNAKFGNFITVKLFNLRIELPSSQVYKISQDKVEDGNQLLKFGYDDKGVIQQISPEINRVPEVLPWFITSLRSAFYQSKSAEIEGIQHWDVSNVTDMESMFSGSVINQSIGHWDVRKVKNFEKMFWSATNFQKSIVAWEMNENAITKNFMNSEVPIWQNNDIWRACAPKLIQQRYNSATKSID